MVLGVGGPLVRAPAERLVAEAFESELERQRVLFDDASLADLAHVVAAIESGVVPRTDGAALLTALLELHAGARDFAFDPALGDLYTNREAWLSERTPSAGWLGVGRARRESVTTAYALAVRRRTISLARECADAAGILAASAVRHARTVMPDYTYLQAAQPTTFGHYLLGFAYPLLRDADRARALEARLDRSPAGVGSTNGSTLPLDRRRIAEFLGFGSLVEHARDAMWQADLAIEALAVACAAIVGFDRLAEDLAVFATAEFGFVELSDAHARASKAMPQKKNPYALAYVRAVANRTIGLQAGVAAANRTPSGQLDNRLFAYGDVPAALDAVTGTLALACEVVRDLRFDESAAVRALERSWTFAAEFAELVMREGGVDYRTAHTLVARLARVRGPAPDGVADHGAMLDELASAARDMLGREIHLKPRDLAAVIDPHAAVERRDGPGGASPARVAEMVADVRARQEAIAAWSDAARATMAEAERALFDTARSLSGSA
ncbi:MAG: argininosuccinate lyase [Vulcanimicrobiaceae bacterium]